MKVTCQACSAQYTIADDKVKGRKVKIRCKACQTPIVVDGQNPPAESVGSGQSEAPPSLDPFAPETAMSNDADVWNVNLTDTDSRTMTTAEVIESFRAGVVTTDAFVWKDGMTDWVAIMDCVELAPLLQGPTDPPAPVAGQTPFAPAVAPAAAPKVGGVPMLAGAQPAAASGARAASAKPQSAADLFGDIATAGSEGEDVDVATSAPRGLPVMPGSTAYDDKPTGARNENSVLFSLDAMKAGFVGSSPSGAPPDRAMPAAPKPAPRSTQPSNPDDPFGMGGSPGLGGIGTGFSLNANQALLTAPAPPEPKPVVVPAFAPASGAAAAGMDAKTKRLVMLGGLGAGAVILVLLGALLFGGKSESEETAAASSSAAAADRKEEPKAEEKKEEPKAEEKKEEPAPAASAAPDEKKEEPKAEAAKTDPGKTGTHSTSTAATKKEEPATPGPSTAPPFSKASAISALGGAASSAAGCKKAGGPTGTGKVQVTFAPSGRVTSATVMGSPFAGTAVGGCVASRFRAAKVPAFAGSPVTVSKSFAIN
ncbi:MAG: hypothetical protein EOO73_01065 [Myxococcales bacterium]|nr:MAG: hypothetical protein EOO73_01065 [Myxococcales bacterium]